MPTSRIVSIPRHSTPLIYCNIAYTYWECFWGFFTCFVELIFFLLDAESPV